MLITCLLLVLELRNMKTAYRTIWVRNLLRIAKIKQLITRLFLVLEVCNLTPTYMKSWARNLLMWSDFTLGSSKVKRWLIGFGELSFWWIQFASLLQCARSSYQIWWIPKVKLPPVFTRLYLLKELDCVLTLSLLSLLQD